jgi:hypothetical protein
MSCKICIKLEGAVLGLTEAGTRNRAQQKEELRLKAKIDLEKHQRAFHKVADNAAF